MEIKKHIGDMTYLALTMYHQKMSGFVCDFEVKTKLNNLRLIDGELSFDEPNIDIISKPIQSVEYIECKILI